MARTSAASRPLTDHDEIRRWAEQRGAKPTSVRGTGGGEDVGMIRLDFPGYSGAGKLEEISWDEWFDKFDESGLALLVQDQTARGQKSNFNKLVSRETAGVSEGNGNGRRSRDARRGISSTEEEYESSAEDLEDENEVTDEDVEKDGDREESRPRRVTASGNSGNRKRQSRSTGRTRGRSARSSGTAAVRRSSQSGRSRSERSTRTRTATASRGQSKRGSRSSAKKSSGRATGRTSRTSRGSSSRKRAA